MATLLGLAVCGPNGPAYADKFKDDLNKLVDGLPSDAAAIVIRRTACNHWLGEDAYDRARAREIQRAVKQNRCDDLDRDEAALRARYAKDAAIIKALDDAARF